jgi:hypothetical protein
MQIIITSGGHVRCIYAEIIELSTLGKPIIRRASQVEPDQHGQWYADLAPVGGPIIGPFAQRSEALDAEQRWLVCHWLESRR